MTLPSCSANKRDFVQPNGDSQHGNQLLQSPQLLLPSSVWLSTFKANCQTQQKVWISLGLGEPVRTNHGVGCPVKNQSLLLSVQIHRSNYLEKTGGKHMVRAPWPLSSNEQQAGHAPKEWRKWGTKTPQEDPWSHSAQGVCGAEGICEGQHSRDPRGFLGVMALLEQGVGLQWRLLLMCPAWTCARKCCIAHGCQGNPVCKEVRRESLQYPFALSSDFASSFIQRLFTLLWHLKRNQAG